MSLGVSIITYSEPLFRATYEIILLHPSSIRLKQIFETSQASNTGPLSREASALTTKPGLLPLKDGLSILDL